MTQPDRQCGCASTPEAHLGPSRRALLLGLGAAGAAGLLAGCGGGDEPRHAQGDASPLSFKVSDIPVGGGVVLGSAVVTQPSAGTFKAFSSTCTHMRCTVGTVAGGRITCPCHGSQFDAASGAVVHGPATQPLPEKTATVKGDTVIVA